MFKSHHEKPNVETEETIQKDLWRHLSLKSPDIPKPERYPLSSRVNKENIRCDASLKYFSSISPAGTRSSCTSIKQDSDFSEVNKLKSQLKLKYDQVKAKERQLMKLEFDLNQKILCFEEEKEKWCVHISFKLKDIESREEEVEREKERVEIELEKVRIKWDRVKSAMIEVKKWKRIAQDIDLRQEALKQNEEIFEMKVEDLAGYERKVLEYESSLKIKEDDLEKIAEIIETRKKDIEKTAEMFEKIHKQLKIEENYIETQKNLQKSKELASLQEKSLLKLLEKTYTTNKNSKSTQDHSIASLYPQPSEISRCSSPSLSSDCSEELMTFNIRTPE